MEKQKSRSFLIVGCFVIMAALLSCAASQKPRAAADKHFLWEVRGEKSIVFLFGSIHVAKPNTYPLAPIIETAFQFSDILVVEANVMAEDSRDVGIAMIQKGTYPSWDSLFKNLSPETGALVREKLKELERPVRNVEQLRPWMLALVLTGLKLQQLGFSPDLGIDVHFIKQAMGVKKILELESISAQMDMFSSFSSVEQEEFLLYTIADLELVEKQIGSLFDSWKQGNAEDLEAILARFKKTRPGLSGVLEKMLDKRNLRMVEKITGFLENEGRYFVVVGSAHLVGEGGIVRILHKKGYSIRQL